MDVNRFRILFHSPLELTFVVLLLADGCVPFLPSDFQQVSFYSPARLFGGIHFVMESPRWQLFPAYCFCVLDHLFLQDTVQGERTSSVIATVLLAASIGLTLLLCYLFPMVSPFKKGTGPYKVGSVSQYVRSSSSEDQKEKVQEMMVEILYPTHGAAAYTQGRLRLRAGAAGAAAAALRGFDAWGLLAALAGLVADADRAGTSRYFPEGREATDALASFARLPGFIFSHLPRLRVAVEPGAPLAPPPPPPPAGAAGCPPGPGGEGGRFPVAVFCHGLGGNRRLYTAVAAELASQGYVVLCPEFTDGSAALAYLPGGRRVHYRRVGTNNPNEFAIRSAQVEERAAAVGLLLDQLEEQFAGPAAAAEKERAPVAGVGGEDPAGGRRRPPWAAAAAAGLAGPAAGVAAAGAALVGHSFGAAAALRAGRREAHRVGAVMCHDLWGYPLAEKAEGAAAVPLGARPTAFLHSKGFRVWKSNFEKECAFVQTLKKMDAQPQVVQATLVESQHQNFSDIALFAPDVGRWLGANGAPEPAALLRACNVFTAAFLRQAAAATAEGEKGKGGGGGRAAAGAALLPGGRHFEYM